LLSERRELELKFKFNAKASFKIKCWFFGVGKEFKRIAWTNRQVTFKDFLTIVIIVGILAALFFGIDMLWMVIQKAK
jgi:preprotein translocase SecE subunit